MASIIYKYLTSSIEELKQLELEVCLFQKHIKINPNEDTDLTLVVTKQFAGLTIAPEGKFKKIKKIEIYSKNEAENSTITIVKVIQTEKYLHIIISDMNSSWQIYYEKDD